MGIFDSFFDDAVVNAKAAASAVSKKAVTFYDASRHKLSAAEIRGEINKKLKELGKIAYKSEVHGTDLFAEKEKLISDIKELIESLNVINGHIAAIKSQRKCPQCEARVPKNSIFCNICGTKLEDASAEQSVMAFVTEPKAPAEQAPSEAAAPVEEEPAQEAAPAKEAASVEEATVEEVAPVEKEAPAEETVPAAGTPAEEAAPAKEAPAEAAAADKKVPAEEPVVIEDDANEDLFV